MSTDHQFVSLFGIPVFTCDDVTADEPIPCPRGLRGLRFRIEGWLLFHRFSVPWKALPRTRRVPAVYLFDDGTMRRSVLMHPSAFGVLKDSCITRTTTA